MHGVVQAYNVLRGHANLFLNLLNLMRGSTVSGLTSDAEADITIAKVMKAIAVVVVVSHCIWCRLHHPISVCSQLQAKFNLELTKEAAEVVFLGLIHDSLTAVFPRLFEQLHKIRVWWR